MILFSYLLSIYVCLLPLIGRHLSGYLETIFFLVPPLFFIVFLLTRRLKDLSFPTFKLAFVQLLLVVLFFLSCLLSKNPGISFPQLLIWVNSWLIINLLIISNTSERIFFHTLKITAFIYSLIFLTVEIFSFFYPLPIPPDSLFEVSVPPCQLADYIIFAVPLFIFYIKNKSIFFKIAIAVFSLVIITSGSRAAVISLLIGFEIFSHFHHMDIFQKVRPFLYGASMLFLAFFFIFPGVLPGKAGFGNRQLYAEQAVRGFAENPLFGIGPANFLYTSLKYGPSAAGATNSAHNSFLGFLSENGIFFTITFFTLIITCLTKKKPKSSVAFLLVIIAIVNSLISATGWTSPSIFIISLFLILQGTYVKPGKNSHFFIFALLFTSMITVFIGGKNLLSLYYQTTGDYYRSLNYDHTNLESRLQIIRKFHDLLSSDPLFANHYFLFQTLAENTPLPQGESFYRQTFLLNPHGNYDTLRNNLQRYYNNINNPANIKQHQTISRQRQEYKKSKEVSDLYTKIANTPFPQNEDYYYQYFKNFPQDDNRAAYYVSLLNNYIQTENPPPRVAFLVYLINNDSFENVANITIVKKNISRQMFVLSSNLYLNTNRSGTSLEYIKAANKLNPTWTAAKIELANNLYWQPKEHSNWDAYKVIYDCIKKDQSLFARLECRQYAANHFPNNLLKPGNVIPFNP